MKATDLITDENMITGYKRYPVNKAWLAGKRIDSNV
jgi:hypothetical protein